MTSNQPGEQPSYVPPQDPWQGTQGSASPPTDPIPQPARGQFRPGVATPQAPPNVWQQETIAHDDRYGYERPRSRVGLFVLVILIVLALGGAGGYGTWYLITNNLVTANPPANGQQQPGASSSRTFDPAQVQKGDCLQDTNPDPTVADMVEVTCDTPDSFQVLEFAQGTALLEGPDGKFNNDTAKSVCTGVEEWRGAYFVWDSSNDAFDFLFCLKRTGA